MVGEVEIGQECNGLRDINKEQQGHVDVREAFITAEPF